MSWNIRPATIEDAATIAQLHVQGWRDAYGGLVDQTYLDNLDQKERTLTWQRWLSEGSAKPLLACDEKGVAAGFINFGRLLTPIPGQSPIRPLYTAEIYALYTLATTWRQGLGRRLMAAAATELAAMKHRSLCLWVLEGNNRAIDFYKALGGQRCGNKEIEMGGVTKKEICFGWRDAGILQAKI